MPLPLPGSPFPAYSYVPGKFPHPLRDELGHSYGHALHPCPPLTIENWRQHEEYQRGIALFNHGYYWEAHESWEQAWHACGRKGLAADYLKGLIKLAAAGVKSREGRAKGVAQHAARGRELFAAVRSSLGGDLDAPFGISLTALTSKAADIAASATDLIDTSPKPVVVTLPSL